MRSPYFEPFKQNKELDVIVLTQQIDEILFQQMGEYKGKKFTNIESAYEEIAKDLGVKQDESLKSRIPEEDVTGFCLWLKNELHESISKVQISKRLTDTPALVTGQMSSSMRIMMQMMEQSQGGQQSAEGKQMARDNTLELNAAHPIVVNLNQLRKSNKDAASLVAKQLLNNVMIASGIPYNLTDGVDNQYKLLSQYLELMVDMQPVQAQRKQVSQEPILKQA